MSKKKWQWFFVVLFSIIAVAALAFVVQGCATTPKHQTLSQRVIAVSSEEEFAKVSKEADVKQVIYQTFPTVPRETAATEKKTVAKETTTVVKEVTAPPAARDDKNIPIADMEIMPTRELEGKPVNSVCWQVYPDGRRNILRPQIFPVNGANKSAITQEMKDSLATIRPAVTTITSGMKPFDFTCRPAGWKGFVDYNSKAASYEVAPPAPAVIATPTVKAAAAAPKVEAKATPAVIAAPIAVPNDDLKKEIEALKAKIAATPDNSAELQALKDKVATLEQAEAKRQKDAEEAAVAEKKRLEDIKVKQEAAKKATTAARQLKEQYLKKLATLGYKGENAVAEFQKAAKIDIGELGPQTRAWIDKVIRAVEDCRVKQLAGQTCDPAASVAKPALPTTN